MRQLMVWIADWLALLLSDWAHPEQKAAREALEGQIKAQDAVIEQGLTTETVLAGKAATEDQKIVDDEKMLNAILDRPIDKSDGLHDKL